MNHITTQSGQIIIAGGAEGSHIRTKEQYDITFPKVHDRISFVWCRGGLDRHCEYSELENICKEDGIEEVDIIGQIIRSAYFYFDLHQRFLAV